MFRIFKKTTKPTWFDNYTEFESSYMDTQNDNNVILSEKFRLSMNTEQTGLNNNVLLISDNLHKIENFFLSNLLQANCSYVVLDNSAENLKSRTLPFFNYKCYIIKTFGYLYEDNKYYYNPFAYIENVDDVKVMVDSIFEHIGYGVSDKYFIDTMRLLFHISALYVFESQTFPNPTLMDVVDVMQWYKTDEMKDKMLELELKHLNAKAVHFYKVVKDYKQTDINQLVDTFNELPMTEMLRKTEVREMLSRDTINLKGLSTNKQVLYIKSGELGFLATTLIEQAIKETKKNNDRKEANRHVQFVLPSPYRDGGDDLVLDIIDKVYDEKRKNQFSFLAKLSNKTGLNRGLAKTQLFDTVIYRDGCQKETANLLSFLELKCDNLLTKDEILHFYDGDCLIFIKGLLPIKDGEYNICKHQYYKALGERSYI